MTKRSVTFIVVLIAVGCGDWRAGVKQDVTKLGQVEIRLPDANLGYLKQKLSVLPLSVRQPHNKKIPREVSSTANWGEAGVVEAVFPVLEPDLADSMTASAIRVNSEFLGTLCGERMQKVLESNAACGSPVSVRRNDSGRMDVVWTGGR